MQPIMRLREGMHEEILSDRLMNKMIEAIVRLSKANIYITMFLIITLNQLLMKIEYSL